MNYKLIATKTVVDADGFTTDYSWYKDLDTGDNFFILGDSDFYEADPMYADYETSDDAVAREWFDTYEGFVDEEDEDHLDEDVAKTTSGDTIEGEMSLNGEEFVDENGEKHPVNDAGEVVVDEILDEAKALNEAPVITLRDDEINNPDSFDLKAAIHQRVEDEKKAKEEAEAAEKLAKMKEKAAPIFDEFKNSPDPLQTAFENLVPRSGKAETVAGEIARAMMRVLYRDYNDGDKFFMGYGLETCGGSIVYLMDVIGEKFESKVDDILQDAYRFASDFPDALYTKSINELKDIVVEYLFDHEELFATENTEDSREYDYDYLEENQPRFEFEIDACDEIYELIQHEVIDSNDLYNYVEEALSYDSIYKDAEIERPWGRDSSSIVVSNLTIEAYEELSNMCKNEHLLNIFWSDLIDEYSEELEAIENGEYDTDDLDDSDEEE